MNPSTKTALVACITAAAAFAPVPAYSQSAGRPERAGADTVVAASKPGKASRFARLTRAAAAHVDRAVTSAEGATGVSRETMAKAALTASGGGAFAMLASGQGPSAGTALAREVMASGAIARAGKAGRAGTVGMAAIQGAGAPIADGNRAGLIAGNGSDDEDVRVQAECEALAERAMSGDAKAVEQFTRLQRELMTGATRLQSRPAAAQQTGMTAMLREAMACACAKTGRGCRSQG